ncbi:unnamed protein product [Linum trigynum]|uniref:Reverse transcriptase zinc-binding domain-containing protein n=1 Tax=Linum trigynum TaxID=586398 RepID=A0AAV2E4L6_9ROSI
MRNALPTGDRVSEKSTRCSDKCPFYDIRETQIHFFAECPWTTRLWRQSTLSGCFEARRSDDCLEWAKRVMTAVDGGTFEEWCSLLWTLWKERNAQLFNGQKMPEEEIVT